MFACRRHARALAACLPRQDHAMITLLLTNRFVSTTTNSMKCLVIWIPLRIRVHSRNSQPVLTQWQDQICSKKKSLDFANSSQNSNSEDLFQVISN